MRLLHKKAIGDDYARYNTAEAFYRHPRKFLCVNVVIIEEEPKPDFSTNKNVVRFRLVQDTSAIIQNKRSFGVWKLQFISSTSTDGRDAYYCHWKENDPKGASAMLTVRKTDKGYKTPKFFFTATMEGCTLAVGSKTIDGTFMVTHYNVAPVSAIEIMAEQDAQGYSLSDEHKNAIKNKYASYDYKREVQNSLQRSAARAGSSGSPVQLIEPEVYRPLRTPDSNNLNKQVGLRAIQSHQFAKATTFGIKVGKEWIFYTHRYVIVQDTPLIVRLDGTYKHFSGPIRPANSSRKEQLHYEDVSEEEEEDEAPVWEEKKKST